ncbi:transposase [Fimbriiglobus ruber]|uniref:Transposase n=1 Tax=Fimbriiglobus ruber TaxID=1908690 RepID=A0A225DC86_9BACT|nr:helix-turn-helix domain-containing protein [Fimbriiglobus ruber]OWK39200.1 transposase [Fimbriiglobus ruber]
MCRETVCRWWSAYTAGGVGALPGDRPGRPLGSGRLLSDEQAERVQVLLRTTTPEMADIAAPLWTRRAVRELIERDCGVTLAVRTVGLYLPR